ncbi:hypothetical protein BDZ91DRAFT_801105 [Kalaharituber pfeilii]|nr:hypothetical protein BDZ91DRAFT_801105 [Kalaharituber pfeilii]
MGSVGYATADYDTGVASEEAALQRQLVTTMKLTTAVDAANSGKIEPSSSDSSKPSALQQTSATNSSSLFSLFNVYQQPSFPTSILVLAITPILVAAVYKLSQLPVSPPPSDLPPRNTRAEFTLQGLLVPILLLFIALLIDYPSKRSAKWPVAAVFVPAVFLCNWKNLQGGSRSSAHGFAIGIYVALQTYRTLDLLVFSNPRTDFFRVPIAIQREYYLNRPLESIPSAHLEAYPDTMAARIPWVFELITTMRYIGWHTPKSPPTTARSLLQPQISRARFFMLTLLRLLAMWLLIDALIWNIRENDTGFFLPYLVASRNSSAAVPEQVAFTLNIPSIAPYPTLALHRKFPFLSLPPPRLPQPDAIRALKYPYPRYFLPAPTPSSSTVYADLVFPLALQLFRVAAQTLAIYAGITGDFAMVCLFVILLSYIAFPPWTRDVDQKLQASRWFNPAAYPHPFSFDTALSESSPPVGVLTLWTYLWHGLFRRAFVVPFAAMGFPRAAKTFGVFLLSGILHMFGAHTEGFRPETTDMSYSTTGRGDDALATVSFGGFGELLFFVLQALGVLVENYAREIYITKIRVLVPQSWLERYGHWVRAAEQLFAILWMLVWFTATADWFFAELRWGGVWRCEASPFSTWQMGWWRWGTRISLDKADTWGWWEWSGETRDGWGIVL